MESITHVMKYVTATTVTRNHVYLSQSLGNYDMGPMDDWIKLEARCDHKNKTRKGKKHQFKHEHNIISNLIYRFKMRQHVVCFVI